MGLWKSHKKVLICFIEDWLYFEKPGNSKQITGILEVMAVFDFKRKKCSLSALLVVFMNEEGYWGNNYVE